MKRCTKMAPNELGEPIPALSLTTVPRDGGAASANSPFVVTTTEDARMYYSIMKRFGERLQLDLEINSVGSCDIGAFLSIERVGSSWLRPSIMLTVYVPFVELIAGADFDPGATDDEMIEVFGSRPSRSDN